MTTTTTTTSDKMAGASLLTHYLEYLLSPPVLLTLWILLIPVLLDRYKDKIVPSGPEPFKAKGCFRLGLRGPSNLSDQYRNQQPGGRHTSIGDKDTTGTTRIKALFTYPLKSCYGVELAASEVAATGLKYDRLFTFAEFKAKRKGEDEKWTFITQRQYPKMTLVKIELHVPDPRVLKNTRDEKATSNLGAMQKKLERDWAINGGCMIVRFPGEPVSGLFRARQTTVELRIPLVPTPQRAAAKGYTTEDLTIWKDIPEAHNMTSEIPAADLAALRAFLGMKPTAQLALFRVKDTSKRIVTRSLPLDRNPDDIYNVGFADSFPVNILNLASVRVLDDALPDDAPMKRTLDARRFRANIFVTGPSPFAEDTWKRITLGRCIAPRTESTRDRSPVRGPSKAMVETDGLFHVAERATRCKLPNTDPATGVMDRNEPWGVMRKVRQVEIEGKPNSILGMHMIPLFGQGILRVGDEVEVLERGEHVGGKVDLKK